MLMAAIEVEAAGQLPIKKNEYRGPNASFWLSAARWPLQYSIKFKLETGVRSQPGSIR